MEGESHLLGTLEAVLSGEGNSKEVLVRVDQGVDNGNKGGVVEGQRDGSNGLDTGAEAVEQLLLVDVEDGGGEGLAVVVNLHDTHSVGERRDVQHVEQSSLGGTDTGTGVDDLDIGNDFNGTTGDLGWDTQSLEESGLSGLHTGVSGGDTDIPGSEGTGTGGGGNLVGDDEVANLLQVGRGEDKTDVASDVGEETFVLGVLGEESTEGTTDHGVLSHEDDTLATESDTDLMHLVGSNIVDVDDEDGGCKW